MVLPPPGLFVQQPAAPGAMTEQARHRAQPEPEPRNAAREQNESDFPRPSSRRRRGSAGA
eukprot:11731579-Alexandrium_andersonii.AAC.1